MRLQDLRIPAVPSRVVSAVVNDPKAKATREIDVVAIAVILVDLHRLYHGE